MGKEIEMRTLFWDGEKDMMQNKNKTLGHFIVCARFAESIITLCKARTDYKRLWHKIRRDITRKLASQKLLEKWKQG